MHKCPTLEKKNPASTKGPAHERLEPRGGLSMERTCLNKIDSATVLIGHTRQSGAEGVGRVSDVRREGMYDDTRTA